MKELKNVVRGVRRLAVSISGLGGSRKTSLAMHLPAEGEGWVTPDGKPGKILYVAADRTSPDLESIHSVDLDRIHMIVPDGDAKVDPRTNAVTTDWKKEMGRICKTDWKAKDPEIVAIVYDTVTANANKVLMENMEMGYFSKKGPSSAAVEVDDPRFKFEKEDSIALGDMGDYRMVKDSVLRQLDWLLDFNSTLHIFCLFQEGMSDKDKDGRGMVIGPSIVGRTGPKEIPYHFGTVLHLTPDPAKGGITRIQCQSAEKTVACIKGTLPGKVPTYTWVNTADPEECRKFWLWIQSVKRGETK